MVRWKYYDTHIYCPVCHTIRVVEQGNYRVVVVTEYKYQCCLFRREYHSILLHETYHVSCVKSHSNRDGHQNFKLLLTDLNQMHLIGGVKRNNLVFYHLNRMFRCKVMASMQPSMGTLNSPSSSFVKDSTPISRSNLEVYKFRDW